MDGVWLSRAVVSRLFSNSRRRRFDVDPMPDYENVLTD
jgi:hypothetical protein